MKLLSGPQSTDGLYIVNHKIWRKIDKKKMPFAEINPQIVQNCTRRAYLLRMINDSKMISIDYKYNWKNVTNSLIYSSVCWLSVMHFAKKKKKKKKNAGLSLDIAH